MNFNILRRVSRIAAIGAILLSSASCVYINEELGQNLIPTDQLWDVFNPEAEVLEDIQLQVADSLSAYNSSRFTFGSINDPIFGTSIKSTSFTLVPVLDTMDFGKNTKVRQFHFTAVRDTLSTFIENQEHIIQNVYVSELKAPLDTFALYTGTFMNPGNRDKYLNTEKLITAGIPVYDGGDSLSFDFSKEFAESIVRRLHSQPLDSMDLYTKIVPGIYITTDEPQGEGGRINLFNLNIESEDTYVTGNYAELKYTADYGERTDVDTSFLFFFGPGDFIEKDSNNIPTQFAFNTSTHQSVENGFVENWNNGNKEKLYIELSAAGITKTALLKVPHHGVYNDGIDAFLAACAPQNAIITCSDKNPPDPETLSCLHALDAKTFLTADGDIRVVCTEDSITVTQ